MSTVLGGAAGEDDSRKVETTAAVSATAPK
jgi:hypothetical protein